jgi:transcriptional regulator GlxA family with amidase domain
MAPYQWLLLHRIDAARSLAAAGRHTPVEIAALCGFGDAGHLADVIAERRLPIGTETHLN